MSSTIEKHTNHWESDDAPAARPILPNDSLLSIFGTDQKLAIQGVLSDEQIQWERIHLIRIGNESPQQANPVCILIVLHQSSKQHDAALLAPKIMAKLQNSDETNRQWWRPENKSLDGCSRDLVVTLASMPIELFADGGVELGNTVDTENESGTFRGQGTAGPTLDLFGIDGSHLSRCFLTCHHVVSSLAEPLSRDQENGKYKFNRLFILHPIFKLKLMQLYRSFYSCSKPIVSQGISQNRRAKNEAFQCRQRRNFVDAMPC